MVSIAPVTPSPFLATLGFTSDFLSTDILDDFNRPNGSIGTNWSGNISSYNISSNRLSVDTTSGDIYWNANYLGVDQEVFVTLVDIDPNATEIGLILKSQNVTIYGSGLINVTYLPNDNIVQVWTYQQPTGWQQRGANLPVNFSDGDQFGAKAKANGEVEIYQNGVLLGIRNVGAWPFHSLGGYIGLFIGDTSVLILDDFGGGTSSNSPTLTPTPHICTDPTTCNPVWAQPAYWRCDIPECTGADWVGTVISWPSWSAYENNARAGNNSRTVFSPDGTKLYPYMGSWADGCQVTAISGVVLIIEWQRGTESWRETYLYPGQSHTIDLISPEDNAMLESPNTLDTFTVSLANCNPQNIYSTATSTPTSTPTVTASYTPTFTAIPTDTPSATATFTHTPISTATASPTPTFTATLTDTPTPTATSTLTSTPTSTFTATHTTTPTATSLPPTVVSIIRTNANPTNLNSVGYTVTFSEGVTGVSVVDFALTTTGVTGAEITSITGSGSNYTVSISTGTGNGTIRLDVVDDDSIMDAMNNPLGGIGLGNGAFTSGEAYSIAKMFTTLVNSVLPTSRSVQVGTTATVFNTVLNGGGQLATGVTLSMANPPAGTFAYQESSCSTNALIGGMNPVLDIPAGQARCYVLFFTPSVAFASTDVHIRAQAANAPATNLLPGINTWTLRATSSAGPDIIALTTTTDFHQVACSGTKPFAVAMSNVGRATSQVTVSADTGSTSLPLTTLIQETDPGTGVVIGDNILENVGAGENRTVVVWVTFNGCVSFDPATHRIFIRFKDSGNNLVGSTSTAVSTNR